MTNRKKAGKQANAARHNAALPAFCTLFFGMLLFCILIFTGCAASKTTGTAASGADMSGADTFDTDTAGTPGADTADTDAADASGADTAGTDTAGTQTAADGEYTVEVSLEGGSGKASVSSPADLILQDGEYTASIEWSSPYYDYMILDGETYYPVNADGNSVFEIPVTTFDEPIAVTADTTAMSTPHEIDYTLTFYADTITPKNEEDESDAGDGDAADSESSDGEDAASDASGADADSESSAADDAGNASGADDETGDGSASDVAEERDTDISAALIFTGSMEITYAEQFTVDYYTYMAGTSETTDNAEVGAAGSTGTVVSTKTAAGCAAENVNTAAAAGSGADTAVNVNTAAGSSTDTAVSVNTAAASGLGTGETAYTAAAAAPETDTSARWALITISGEDRFLVVPEEYSEADVPADLDEDIAVILRPAENLYLAASAVMDMFIALDALDTIRFSGTDTDGWYLEEAVSAMESGDILYAGKYSAPDYEQLLAEGCTLAIENTMIYHTPEVQEQLERLGISVLVDHSSYETEPLGRIEWVKLYGVLLGKEEEAEEAFAEQEAAFAQIADAEDTGLTVAFFYITSSGEVNVRKSADYLAKLINMAGGEYIFTDLGDEEDASSTVTLTMEEFYAAARDADYLIYNSTIDGELSSVDELLGKSELLANFKAVKEGNVYCTAENFYQSSMELGDFVLDIAGMLAGEDDLTFLHKLD